MRVKMLIKVYGPRADKTEWPPVGGILETDEYEGQRLLAAGLAIPESEPMPERDRGFIDCSRRYQQ